MMLGARAGGAGGMRHVRRNTKAAGRPLQGQDPGRPYRHKRWPRWPPGCRLVWPHGRIRSAHGAPSRRERASQGCRPCPTPTPMRTPGNSGASWRRFPCAGPRRCPPRPGRSKAPRHRPGWARARTRATVCATALAATMCPGGNRAASPASGRGSSRSWAPGTGAPAWRAGQKRCR